jgi:anti-anti-sigma factor
VDLSTADNFAKALDSAIQEPASAPFLLDFSGVRFIDSTGMYGLTRVVDRHADVDFVVQASREVFRVLEFVGMTNGAWPNVMVIPLPDDEPA